MPRGHQGLIHKLCLLALIGVALLSSCSQNNQPVNKELTRQFRYIDSITIAGKGDSARKLLAILRPRIAATNPLICNYYCYLAESRSNGSEWTNKYADSALAFFNIESRRTKFPHEYYRTLLVKGDASLKGKKYISALNYYYKAKTILPDVGCDNGYLSAKMGSIYFNQRNFLAAARYLAESCRQLEACDTGLTTEKLFFLKQGAYNNAGFAYERAGVLDTAMYYYTKDIKVTEEAERSGASNNANISAAWIVIYDNLGGLYIKKGDIHKAEEYLTKCLAIPHNDSDGLLITALLKLAEVYSKNGNDDKELAVLNRVKIPLDRLYADNPESVIKWNKLYADYLFRKKQPALAYTYQGNYIRLRDSLDNNSAELYRLDVERELNMLQQQNELVVHAQKDRVTQTYLVGIAIIALLSVIIILLINRNLKRTQKSHRDATQQNQQLQHTLDELEHVNKNYIRIMRVMAHDLRNPLSGMTGLAAMLLSEDDFSEESKHMLKLIETTGTHSMEMINELLKSGLADENEQIVKQQLDLSSLLYDSVELLQFKANEKHQQIIFTSDAGPIMAEVNHEKIWRVFNNLIVNAIKFSHEMGSINVNISRKEKNILVSIADNGVGIPDKDKDNVFEMFTPAKKFGTHGEQPFGLGLSISKKIIEKHNGKIWFESNPGAGTTFYIELPALD